MKNKRVVLAYSGGLDTSYCLKFLSNEKKMEVYSAIVNTGGFTKKELTELENKAYDLGSKKHICLENTEEFYENIVKYLIYGNVLKNNTYPLSVSAERVYQAIALAKYAKEIDAEFLAHGSTGAGNDQIRFDLIFQLIAPEIQIISLTRDQKLSRVDEINYLRKNGVEMDWESTDYSINKGLWGTSVGGKETLSSHQTLPEKAYPSQLKHCEPKNILIEFNEGEICGLDNQKMKAIDAIQKLNEIASEFAIGRDIHVGDTIIGIKGRVGFEAAAAQIIIKAHHSLEKHNLSKWQLHYKEQIASWYGMFIHEAQYLDPVMRDLEACMKSSQKYVTGFVNVTMHPHRFEILGIESKHDLMNSDFGEYGEMNKTWSSEDVKGFTKILANPMRIYHQVNKIEC